jgi:uncharacterized membrane protein YdjX (TVP38/TMEM64 family)
VVRSIALTAIAAALVPVAWLAASGGAASLLAPIAAVRSMGAFAPLAFILAYAMLIVAFVPASLLTLAGGALFGMWRSVLYVLAGAYLGQSIAFLVGRYLARHVIERRLETMPRLRAVNRAVSADARRIVFLLRLSPVMPFNILNYMLGATPIGLLDFTVGSVGMLPGTVLFSYAGALAGQALALAGRAGVPHTPSYYMLLVAGLVATAAATILVARTARNALRDVDLGNPL